MDGQPDGQDGKQTPKASLIDRLAVTFAIAGAAVAAGMIARETPPLFVTYGHDDIASALIATVGMSNKTADDAFYHAMFRNDAHATRFLMDHGYRPDRVLMDNAIINGKDAVVDALLDKGVPAHQGYLEVAAIREDGSSLDDRTRLKILDSLARHGGKIDQEVLVAAVRADRSSPVLHWILEHGNLTPEDIAAARVAAVEDDKWEAFSLLHTLDGAVRADDSRNGELLVAAVGKDPAYMKVMLLSLALTEEEIKAALTFALENGAEESFSQLERAAPSAIVKAAVADALQAQDEKTKFLIREGRRYAPSLNFVPGPG